MKHKKQRYGWCDEIASMVDMSKLTIEGGEEMTTRDVVDRLNQLEAENEAYLRLDEEGYASLAVQLVELEDKKDDAYGEVKYLSIQQRRLRKKEASARAIMQRFVDKVDSGRARSTETYAEMTEWLKNE